MFTARVKLRALYTRQVTVRL